MSRGRRAARNAAAVLRAFAIGTFVAALLAAKMVHVAARDAAADG